jgi:regulator of replication initiation timing
MSLPQSTIDQLRDELKKSLELAVKFNVALNLLRIENEKLKLENENLRRRVEMFETGNK